MLEQTARMEEKEEENEKWRTQLNSILKTNGWTSKALYRLNPL
ncbi:unnamed protein product [Camellia sinensis]